MLADSPNIGWATQEKRINVSDLTLRHELGVMDCKAALFTAVRSQPEFTLAEFATWPLRIQFKAVHPVSGAKILVKPDGFIRLKETRRGSRDHFLFLEVDYSTESFNTLAAKLRCYRNYYRHGDFADRLGHHAGEYRRFPFRVLVVCKSEERRNSLKELLRESKPPIKTFACLATFDEFLSDPLKVIDTQPA